MCTKYKFLWCNNIINVKLRIHAVKFQCTAYIIIMHYTCIALICRTKVYERGNTDLTVLNKTQKPPLSILCKFCNQQNAIHSNTTDQRKPIHSLVVWERGCVRNAWWRLGIRAQPACSRETPGGLLHLKQQHVTHDITRGGHLHELIVYHIACYMYY